MTVDEGGGCSPRRRGWAWGLAGAVMVFVCSCSCCIWSLFPTVGVGVAREEAWTPPDLGELPPGATDVSYYRGNIMPASYVEFTIDDAAFVGWAQDLGWALKQFGEEEIPKSVFRPEPFRTAERPEERLSIRRGYAAGGSDPDDPGAGWQVVYDRDARRAYYLSHRR